MEQNTQIREVNTYGEKNYIRDYSEWKQSHGYCHKCLSKIDGDGDFCDTECRKEYFAEQRKLAEEVYEGMYWGI